MSVLAQLFERNTPADARLWHKWNTILWPVHLTDGTWVAGDVWRRFNEGRWQYEKREMTDDERLDNQI